MDMADATDPVLLFDHWYAEARTSEPNDPNAMALATVGADGVPQVRMVLLKEHDQRGFVFFTNSLSRKGRNLAAHPVACLNFHWKSLRRQVRITGPVEPVTDAEADRYFQSRPRDSRIGAWASLQSEPLAERAVLIDRIRDYDALYPGEAVPRPPHWWGYRVIPTEIEFWHDRPYRLHDRIVFTRDREGWARGRLYP